MRKQIAAAVLALCLTLVSVPARAAETVTGRWGNDLTWTYDPGAASLTISGQGRMEIYGSRYDPSGLYQYRDEIVSVRIEEGVTTIANSAFREWPKLSSVSLPDSLYAIESWAFGGCPALKKLHIPDGVSFIDVYAFCESKIEEVNIPQALVSIDGGMFMDCTELRTVTIPAGSRLMEIEFSAFSGCNELREIHIPQGVGEIGAEAFRNCTQLKELEIPNSVTEIHEYAFAGCSNLARIKLPDDMSFFPFRDSGHLAEGVFSECASLTEVEIPEGVSDIGQSAFEKCAALTTVDLPGTVDSIGIGCFRGCPSLKEIRYGGARWQWEQAGNIPSDLTRLGIQDPSAVQIEYLPGGQCGEGVYWSYDRESGLLYIDSRSSPSAVLTAPTDGSQAAWSAALAGDPLIYLEDIGEIENGVFAPGTVIHHSYITMPEDLVFHKLERVSATDRSELCTTGGHTQGYRCSEGCTLPGSLAPKERGIWPHDVTDYRKTATCVETGLDCGKKCRRCGKVLVEPLETPLGSHTRGEIIGQEILEMPTADRSGWMLTVYRCKYCDATLTAREPIPAGTIPDAGPFDPSHPTILTITFDPNGGKLALGGPVKSTNDDGDRKLTALPANPTRNGYAFNGWYSGPQGGTKITTALIFRNDATVYAGWVERIGNIFTVTFDSNHGSGDTVFDAAATASDGTLDAMPTHAPARTGYAFDGWYTAVGGGDPVTAQTVFTEDTTVYAHWTPDGGDSPEGKYTVTFDLNYTGAPANTTSQVSSGGKAAKPADPTRTGYTFGGWYREAACTTEWDFAADTVSADITLYAKWTAGGITPDTAYTVTFNANGGTVTPSSARTGSDGKAALPTPTRTGYTFAGWWTAASGGTRRDAGYVFTADATLYAHWTRDGDASAETRYRIYAPGRIAGGSVTVSHSRAAEGTRITVELDPRSGYELDEISAVREDTGRSLRLTRRYSDEYTFTMPDSDVELDVSFVRWDRDDPGPVSRPSSEQSQPVRSAVRPAEWYYSGGQVRHTTGGAAASASPLSRDMLISVLYGLDGGSSGEPAFWAVKNEILPDIYGIGLWGADQPVSREQAAVILFSFARHMGCDISQTADITACGDYESVQPMARSAMSWARATGIMEAAPSDTLAPQAVLTCAESNGILSRLVSNVMWHR